MRRRAFLVGAAGVAGAGCLDRSGDGDRHPFAGETVTVRVDKRSDTDHDLGANARQALAFWEEHAETYAGFDVAFDLVESEEPDLVIAYADDLAGCETVAGASERVLGCAPILGPGIRVPQPVVARVVAGGRPFGKIRITTKHELGHVLGLGHEDEPRRVMSNRPEDRIPLYDLRIDVWEQTLAGVERTTEAGVLYRHAVEAWNQERYEPAGPAFAAARAAFADATTTFEAARSATTGFEGHPQVETVDIEGVRAALSTLTDRAELLTAVADTMREASEAAAAGDSTTAGVRLDEARGDLSAFRDIGPVQTRDVAVTLGLVRGFDRTDPAIDPGVEPE